MKLKFNPKVKPDSSHNTLIERALKLSATNRRLQSSISRHKGAEIALKKRCEHYSKLFKDSMQLQVGLRQFTRHLLAAQEDQRHKISHDLQDEIAQILLGINVRLLSLNLVRRGSSKVLKEEIASTQQLVAESAGAVRKLARALHIPPPGPAHDSRTKLRSSVPPNTEPAGNSPSKL